MFLSGRILEAAVVGGDSELVGDGCGVDGDEIPGGDRGDGESVDDEGVGSDDGPGVVVGCTRQYVGGPDSGLGACWERSAEEYDVAPDERVDERLVIDIDVGPVGWFMEEHEEVHGSGYLGDLGPDARRLVGQPGAEYGVLRESVRIAVPCLGSGAPNDRVQAGRSAWCLAPQSTFRAAAALPRVEHNPGNSCSVSDYEIRSGTGAGILTLWPPNP